MASLTPDDLRTLVETTVTADQIDHLGHMNVRFYAQHARTAGGRLAEQLGLSDTDGLRLQLADSYTRHYREQVEGARLSVRGGPLGADGHRLRAYHELVNDDDGELAATFVHELHLVEAASRSARDLPEDVVAAARERAVDIPAHGQPRSLSLEPEDGPVPLGVLRERGLAMRKVRTITDVECDEDGFFPSSGFAELVWGGELPEGSDGWMFGPGSEMPIGMATMESRVTITRLPRPGDRVQSFGAEVGLGAKTSHRRQWVYDVDRAAPLLAFSVLGLTFDLRTRKSVEIPPELRQRLEAEAHPDLAPS